MRILLIEAKAASCAGLRSHLTKSGFAVDLADRASAPEMAEGHRYEVILLDLIASDADAALRIAALRRDGGMAPVIALSEAGGAGNRIKLLEAGADDVLTRPFDLGELVARVRVVTRRGRMGEEQPLLIADLSFFPAQQLALVNDKALLLRPRELALLEALLRRAGRPVRREQLLSHVYAADEEIGSNSLDVHVHNLRQKLAAAGANVKLATVRGVGYALQAGAAGLVLVNPF